MELVDLRLTVCREGHHHLVPYARRLSVKGFNQGNGSSAPGSAPGDKAFKVHHAPDAQLARQGVIELCASLQIIGLKRHVTDHCAVLPVNGI